MKCGRRNGRHRPKSSPFQRAPQSLNEVRPPKRPPRGTGHYQEIRPTPLNEVRPPKRPPLEPLEVPVVGGEAPSMKCGRRNGRHNEQQPNGTVNVAPSMKCGRRNGRHRSILSSSSAAAIPQ